MKVDAFFSRLPAPLAGGLSLIIWISVLVAGRMEAFFKPIFVQP